MASRDIRFNREKVLVKHASERGEVARNAGDFTRGSQLITHQWAMTFSGVRVPLIVWAIVFVVVLNVTLWLRLQEHEVQLILHRLMATTLLWLGLDPARMMQLTLPGGAVHEMATAAVSNHPAVMAAWSNGVKCLIGST